MNPHSSFLSDHAPGLCGGGREGLVLFLGDPDSSSGEMSWQVPLLRMYSFTVLSVSISVKTARQ